MILYDSMELDDVRAGTTCVMCNLTYDGSNDDHAEECCMHGYCTILRRWEEVMVGSNVIWMATIHDMIATA
jgi:hypothetical protein